MKQETIADIAQGLKQFRNLCREALMFIGMATIMMWIIKRGG